MTVIHTEPIFDSFFEKRPQNSLTTVDMGNSHPHSAFFKKGKPSSLKNLKTIDELKNKEYPVVISSVTEKSETSFEKLWQKNSFCNMPVHYNKNQIGADRLYQSAFLFNVMSGADIILVDAGTFITVDHITPLGFIGGHIYPGPQTFLKSYNFGKRLPNLEFSKHYAKNKNTDEFPSTTEDAILEATQNYLKNLCQSIKEQYPQKKIILTGGYADYLNDNLPNAQTIHHLIHYSLYFLYQELVI